MDNTSQSYWEWLTWVFQKGNDAQCRLFCYALWAIWDSRNQFIYERKNSTGRVIAQSIQRQMAEIEGVRDLKTQKTMVRKFGVQEDLPKAAIQFDAAFDKRSFKSATGLVGWDQNGDLLVLKTVIHKKVSSAFAAEALENSNAHKLARRALDREESIYLMGADLDRTPSEHHVYCCFIEEADEKEVIDAKGDDLLVVSAIIASFQVKRILMNTGSSIDILAAKAFC
ncbi:hypothetical protein Gogos_000126 [Gossypium gossypioides]|uniref:Uncharacterized protein n=1 Tax=Gossypium gossypioides TaxID=34282 RepID=A0A7J9D3C6_GOSGO|nr:hypothetical protein [Gossypium gossypioides]